MSIGEDPLVGAKTIPDGVDPLGPVFVSYRSSDGAHHASALAWALRATGVPVWHDETDLPPGDTTKRLNEALGSGLSGAVLVVTPEIERSGVVREVELPRLLDLESKTEFTLAVASVVDAAEIPGKLDFDAPDRLLEQPPGTLSRLKQYRLFDAADVTRLAHELAMQRMQACAALGVDLLVIDIQTRAHPTGGAPHVDLAVRTRPPTPGRRAPPPDVWGPYAAFLAYLPRLVAASGATSVEVRGGAHLSVAFALGAALPVTSGTQLVVVDRAGSWESEDREPAPPLVVDARPEVADGPAFAISVDLLETPAPIDTFSAHLVANPGAYAGSLRLSPAARAGLLPEAAGATMAAIDRHIRDTVAQYQVNRLDLFLRLPFPLALLLGRRLNTFAVDPYEWEGGDTPPRYVRTATVASGTGGGPIVETRTGS